MQYLNIQSYVKIGQSKLKLLSLNKFYSTWPDMSKKEFEAMSTYKPDI